MTLVKRNLQLLHFLPVRTVQSVRDPQQRAEFLNENLLAAVKGAIKKMRGRRIGPAVITRDTGNNLHLLIGKPEQVKRIDNIFTVLMMRAVINKRPDIMKVRGEDQVNLLFILKAQGILKIFKQHLRKFGDMAGVAVIDLVLPANIFRDGNQLLGLIALLFLVSLKNKVCQDGLRQTRFQNVNRAVLS